MSSTTKIIVGIAAAAVAGIAIGVLLAPEKGSDTRQRIKDTATGWSSNMKAFFSKAKNGLANGKGIVRSKTSM